MQKTAEGFVEYVRSQLGKPYWYGTFGQSASLALYLQKKKQYPKYYTWEYDEAVNGQKVHDCVGLVKGYLWCDSVGDGNPVYVLQQDLSANGMYAAGTVKGDISTMPEVSGILVFMNGHMGVYLGAGEVVEARGHRYGVVKTKLADRPWKSWSYCPFLAYPTNGKTVSVPLPVLKKGSKGSTVQAMQQLLIGHAFSCGEKGTDGSFGGATDRAVRAFQKAKGLDVDGSCGKKTWQKLLGVE